MMISPQTRGIMVCAASFLYQCMLGAFYIWGTISVYVASFFRQYDPNVTTRELTTFMPIRAALLMFLLPMGSYMEQTFGPRKIVLIGAVSMTLGVFLLRYITSPTLFVLDFAFAFGVPTIAFYVPMMCVWKYFPDKRGLMSGISVCGFSLGSLFFSYLSRVIVNPNNVSPTEYEHGAIKDHYFESDVYNNVPKLFTILSVIWGLILTYTVVAVQDPPKEYVEKLALEQQQKTAETGKSPENNDCPSLAAALRHRTFWILTILMTVSTWSDFIFGLAYKEIGFYYHYSDSYLTFVGVLYSLANACGRLWWGFAYQHFPYKPMYCVILFGQAFFAVTLLAVAWSPILYPMWIMLCTFFTCGNFVTFAPLSVKVYGTKKAGNIYSFICTGFAFGALVLYVVNVYVLPYVGYKVMLEILGYLSVTLYGLVYLLDLSPKWEQKQGPEDTCTDEKEIQLLEMRKGSIS